jgi:uncharacterized protein (DUF488 family)
MCTGAAKQALEELAALIGSQVICLLCFERNPAECHRSIIAQKLSTRGIIVQDLFADSHSSNVRKHKLIESRHFGEGLAAAE